MAPNALGTRNCTLTGPGDTTTKKYVKESGQVIKTAHSSERGTGEVMAVVGIVPWALGDVEVAVSCTHGAWSWLKTFREAVVISRIDSVL